MTTVQSQGNFVVLEGNQGLGKTTQVRLVEAYLFRNDIPNEVFYFPRYGTFFGKMATDFLKGKFGKLEEISPYFIALIFANDRMLAKPEIMRALAAGKLVIADRWVSSNMAIQAAKLPEGIEREKFIAWVKELEYEVFGQCQPDFTIYLRARPEVSLQNLSAKEAEGRLEGRTDIEEADQKLIYNSFFQYEKLSATLPNWITLDLERDGREKGQTEILSTQEVHYKVLCLLAEIGALPKPDFCR
jgi:dTMP kinase